MMSGTEQSHQHRVHHNELFFEKANILLDCTNESLLLLRIISEISSHDVLYEPVHAGVQFCKCSPAD